MQLNSPFADEEFERQMQTGRAQQLEMMNIVSKGSPTKSIKGGEARLSQHDLEKFVGEDAFRSQIEELVRQQLNERDQVKKKLDQRKMNSTGPNFPIKYNNTINENSDEDEIILKRNLMGISERMDDHSDFGMSKKKNDFGLEVSFKNSLHFY